MERMEESAMKTVPGSDTDLLKGNLKDNEVQPKVRTEYLYYNEYTRVTTTFLYSGKSALVQALELKTLNDEVDWNAAPPWEKPKVSESEGEADWNDVVVFDQVEVMTSNDNTSQPREKWVSVSGSCTCTTSSRRRLSLDSDSDSAGGELILAFAPRRVRGVAGRRGGRRLTFPRSSTPTGDTELILSSNSLYNQFFEDL